MGILVCVTSSINIAIHDIETLEGEKSISDKHLTKF